MVSPIWFSGDYVWYEKHLYQVSRIFSKFGHRWLELYEVCNDLNILQVADSDSNLSDYVRIPYLTNFSPLL